MTTFLGAVLRERGLPRPYVESRPLEIVELELPDPGEGEVLVKIGAASLCRSDLSVVTGARVWPLPMVIGHEAAGKVVAVGSGSEGLEPGDDVVLVYLPQCGECVRCVGGEAWLCDVGAAANQKGELLTGGTRLTHEGEKIHHHMGVAAFAEYTLVSQASAVKVPSGLAASDLCVFGCAVLCGGGTALNTAGVDERDSVAIVGLGAVGLSAVLGAKAAGAERIFAVDLLEAKLSSASQLGATDVLMADEETPAQITNRTGGGVDHAIEASGTLEGFELAMRLVRRGGTVTTLGLPGPAVSHDLELARLVARGVTVQGSYLGSCVTSRDVPRFIDLYREGRFPIDGLISHHIALDDINAALDGLISHHIALDDINAALDRLADGEALRQVIEF
jgi:alcohol dehydrogenase